MIDPTKTRLSDTMLLSDAMGNDSCYRWGVANWMDDRGKLNEGKNLAKACDDLHERFGPYLVSYGFICPEASKRIVTYQNPDKPSYHRWDAGAAVDLRFPRHVAEGDNECSPIQLVRSIEMAGVPYSRLITYAESGWVCFGTNRRENSGEPRKALYENRFVGNKTPNRYTYPKLESSRMAKLEEAVRLEHPWEGRGYPSYHGGGRQQYHHIMTSEYTCVSSFLYDKHLVHNGKKNPPPFGNRYDKDNWLSMAWAAGDLIDGITETFGKRVSIIRAYNRYVKAQSWKRSYTLQLIPSRGVHYLDMADHIDSRGGVQRVRTHKVGDEYSIMVQGVPV